MNRTYITFRHWRPTLCFPGWKKKSGKAVWNPSKLGMRSLWECHVPPKVPRLCWKQDHDLPELQKTEGERDWSIIPAGWNHWESKADAWLKSWRYTMYIYIYISSVPRVFSGRNGGLLTVYRDLALWRLDFFSKTHPFFPSSNWTPNLLVPILFWGLGLGVSRKNPVHHEKKQVETHEAKCLVGSPWRLSDVGHPSKLGALDLGSYMAFGGFERPGPQGEMRSLEPERSIYIYISMFISLYIYLLYTYTPEV